MGAPLEFRQTRSMGVTIIAWCYLFASLFFLAFYLAPLYDMFKDRSIFVEAIDTLKTISWLHLIRLFYENTKAVMSVFIAVGLFLLRPWARLLAAFLVGIDIILTICLGFVRFYLDSALPIDYIISLGVLIFLLWFLTRSTTKTQFVQA
jgi:hypothetical protein